MRPCSPVAAWGGQAPASFARTGMHSSPRRPCRRTASTQRRSASQAKENGSAQFHGREGGMTSDLHGLQDRMDALEAGVKHGGDSFPEEVGSLSRGTSSEEEDDALREDLGGLKSAWDGSRNSYANVTSKVYIQTVSQVRARLLAADWEQGMRPIALRMGVCEFEEIVSARQSEEIPENFYDVITQLYDNPTNLEVISDTRLRMQARSCIVEVEQRELARAFQQATIEAQRLGNEFISGEFVSKVIPQPFSTGLIDAVKKVCFLLPFGRQLLNK